MTENPEQTKFNMAIATLQRMNNLLDYISNNALEGNLIKWYDGLIELRRTISPFIKEEEYNEIEDGLKKLSSSKWTTSDSNGRRKVIVSSYKKVWVILDKITIDVQKAMKNAGILMPNSDDPHFALDG